MDARTLKIRELERKLSITRDFIHRVGFCAIESLQDGKVMTLTYWAKESFDKYEVTKP